MLRKDKIIPLMVRAHNSVAITHQRAAEVACLIDLSIKQDLWQQLVESFKEFNHRHGIEGADVYTNPELAPVYGRRAAHDGPHPKANSGAGAAQQQDHAVTGALKDVAKSMAMLA